MYIVNKNYFIALLLILCQIVGGLPADIAILISFWWALIYFSFTKELDLVLIFLLLIPSIVLRNNPIENSVLIRFGISNYGDSTWLEVAMPGLKNVLVIGSVAMSGKLGLALAVPIRMIYFYKKTDYPIFFILWFLVLIIAITGLSMAVFKGISNESGITVGLRIALSMGTIFLPLCIKNKEEFDKSLLKILEISIFLFLAGFLNEHWLFVVAGLLPYVFIRSKSTLIKGLTLVSSLIILVMDYTFTFKGILIVSIILYFFIDLKLFHSIFKSGITKLSVLLFPLILTLIIIYSDQFLGYTGKSEFKRQLSEKINSDRKILWQASYAQICSSFPLVVAGGRPIPVNNFQGRDKWDPGAHNIYLEISRQLGLLAFVILLVSFLNILYNLWIKTEEKNDLILLTGLVSVFLVFGFTGNSLIYDGVGFLFWLIIGQLARFKEA